MDTLSDGGRQYFEIETRASAPACSPGMTAPPAPVPRAERRLQVRAYNLWARSLGSKPLPARSDLGSGAWDEFAEYSVLVDADGKIGDPELRNTGRRLAEQCGEPEPTRVSAVPPASLLGCITSRVPQVLASQAPVGFEAELAGPDSADGGEGTTILCRGILLPFAGENGAIASIWGAVNWKQVADRATTDGLLREISAAMLAAPSPRSLGAIAEWADGPLGEDDAGLLACADTDASCAPGSQAWSARALGIAAIAAREQADAAQVLAETAFHAALGGAHDLACQGTNLDAALDAVFADAMTGARRALSGRALDYARRHQVGAGALPALLAAPGGEMLAFVRGDRRLRCGEP